jgi:hypothetical protein
MAWVAREMPGSRFLIVDDSNWYEDKVAEWFPVLADAVNVGTVQGTEWLPGERFRRLKEIERTVKSAKTCRALIASLPLYGGDLGYVWVQAHPASAETGKPSIRPECFEKNDSLVEIYRNPDVIIFRKASG